MYPRSAVKRSIALLSSCLPLFLLPASSALAQLAATKSENLKAAVQKAVESNPEVLSRWHAFRAAEGERDVAFGAYLPRLDLAVGVGRENRDDPILNKDYNRRSSSLTLTQMLYDGFATRNEVRRLDNARLVRLYELQDASEGVALEVARAYLDVFRYRRLVELAEDNYVRHRAVLDQIQSKVKAGVGRGVDLEQAAGRLALAEANLLTETANLHDVSARYQRLVGVMPLAGMDTPSGLGKDLPPAANVAVKLAQQKNPALLAAIENVRAADAAVEGRSAAFQPRIDFRLRRDDGSNLNGIIGTHATDVAELVLNINFLNGGSDRARMRQFAEQKNVAKDVRDKTCRDTRQTLVIAYNDTQKLAEQLTYLDRHQLSIEKARDAYRKQFDIGQRSLLDLLDTENELFQAKRSYVNAEIDLDAARVRTHAGIGTLLIALGVARREAEQLPQVELSAEDAAEQCPPEAPLLYVADKAELDRRASEMVRESAVAPSPAADAAARPKALPEAAANPQARIAEAVKTWVSAWSGRNLQAYLDAYAPDFVAADGASRADWAARRKAIIERARDITIDVSAVRIESLAADRGVVSFRQDYRSSTYADSVLKTLEMRLLSGRWLIVGETANCLAKTNCNARPH